MECPHCNKPAKIASVVFANADAYNNTKLARTACCQKLVYVRPIRSYEITAYQGSKRQDDWGG
jgi:hypothetical protein